MSILSLPPRPRRGHSGRDRQGFWDEDLRWWEEYGRASQNLGNRAGLATTLHNMGYVALATKDLSLALEFFTHSREVSAAIGLEKDVAEEEEMIAHVKALLQSGAS